MTTVRAAVIHDADGRAPLCADMMRFLLLATALLAVSSAGAADPGILVPTDARF
jgi:hypothetical protein